MLYVLLHAFQEYFILEEEEELNPVYALMCTEDTVAIWDQEKNEFGAVSVIRSHLSCSVCINSTNCNHVRILEELKGSASLPPSAAKMLDKIENEIEDRADDGSRLSFQRIPFLALNSECIGVNKELTMFDRFDSNGTLHLKPTCLPEVEKCSTCQSDWLTADPILYKEKIPLFMDIGIFNANGNSCMDFSASTHFFVYLLFQDKLPLCVSYSDGLQTSTHKIICGILEIDLTLQKNFVTFYTLSC